MAESAYILNPRRRRTTRKRRTTRRAPKRRRRAAPRRAKSMTFTMRRNPSLASYAPNRRRRRYRRNPGLKGLLPFTPQEFIGATAGGIATRQLTDLLLKTRNRGPMGWAGNLAVTVGLSILSKKVKALRGFAKSMAMGGAAFTGARIVGETVFKRAGVAGIVDLGSDNAVTAPALAVVPAGGILPYQEEGVMADGMAFGDDDYDDDDLESDFTDFELADVAGVEGPFDPDV
jgi:hypothetical protein